MKACKFVLMVIFVKTFRKEADVPCVKDIPFCLSLAYLLLNSFELKLGNVRSLERTFPN